ncbi:hypothetical protein E2C01_008855 [Portunus trituberculatus]|uniref:Uncharacterized protein n=1 Tax=Portunus trituberculatus TaxID=210409 RepID=A0A5B7D553_PORTR|nr:hypothetical protein [Portunus trituberculatus]
MQARKTSSSHPNDATQTQAITLHSYGSNLQVSCAQRSQEDFGFGIGNSYPESMPFLTSDRGQGFEPVHFRTLGPQSARGPTAPRRPLSRKC